MYSLDFVLFNFLNIEFSKKMKEIIKAYIIVYKLYFIAHFHLDAHVY